MRMHHSPAIALPSVMDTVYDAASRFSHRYHRTSPTGLLIVTGERTYLDHIFDWDENGTVFQDYRGLRVHEKGLLDLFYAMRKQDGGIVFDDEGNLLGAQLYVQGATTQHLKPTMIKVREILHDNTEGIRTRHASAAYASLMHAPTVTLSETTGIVMGFKEGNVMRSYHPDFNRHEEFELTE